MRKLWLLFFLLVPFSLQARPLKGFYEGPYLTLSAGLMQFKWDVNQRNNVEEGRVWEPMLHLGFGWNVEDWVAPELNLRFFTDSNGGRREYIAGANLGSVFTFLFDPLLSFRSLRILPFVSPSFIFQMASLPGDVNSNDNRVTMPGFGASLGGGVRFLYNEYLYFGLEAREDFLVYPDKSQLFNGLSSPVYSGGLHPQFEGRVMIGVHF